MTKEGLFDFASLDKVWNVLDVSYRNPNEEEDARDALDQLRQGSGPFGIFLAEFQLLYNLSCITDDKMLISRMRKGVSNEMRTCIGQHQEIHKTYSFDEFVDLCKDCVIRLDLERPVPHTYYSTPRSINPRPVHVEEATGPNMSPLGGDPMVLDRAEIACLGKDGRLTPEERERRFRLQLCMQCGKAGHRAHNCVLQRKNKTREQAISRAELGEDYFNDDSLLKELKD